MKRLVVAWIEEGGSGFQLSGAEFTDVLLAGHCDGIDRTFERGQSAYMPTFELPER